MNYADIPLSKFVATADRSCTKAHRFQSSITQFVAHLSCWKVIWAFLELNFTICVAIFSLRPSSLYDFFRCSCIRRVASGPTSRQSATLCAGFSYVIAEALLLPEC